MTRARVFGVSIILAGAVVTGTWFVRHSVAARPARGKSIGEAEGARLFDAVLRRVEASAVDSSSAEELYERATTGLVEQLGDPNTAFLTADRLRRMREVVSGSYPGAGRIRRRSGWMDHWLLAPRPGSPAERSGIRAADRLVEIDGQAMKSWTVEEARNALRGPPGSKVKLVIERGGAMIPLTLERSDIHVRSVQRVAGSCSTIMWDTSAIASFTGFNEYRGRRRPLIRSSTRRATSLDHSIFATIRVACSRRASRWRSSFSIRDRKSFRPKAAWPRRTPRTRRAIRSAGRIFPSSSW